MKKQDRRKKQQLFSPSKTVTLVKKALNRDLQPLLHEYKGLYHPRSVAVQTQLDSFEKKFLDETKSDDDLEAKTFEKFLKVNSHMAKYAKRIPLPVAGRLSSKLDFYSKVLLRARALMHHVLSDFDEDEWFKECRNSSGSSIGVPFSDTSPERKFTYPISTTTRVIPLFERYLLFDIQLNDALVKQNQFSISPKYKQVNGSRATTVDKNNDIRRMICVEPTVNMFLQQGLMHMMYKRMAKFGLDVETLPQLHQLLAWKGSLTRNIATIDWSSASDCESIELLRWLIPPKWFSLCDITRSPVTNLRNEEVTLNMFSTMGNAVTFPLETLVFWTMAHGVRLSMKKGNSLFPEWEDLKEVSVFGDDCIVPTYMAKQFITVMSKVGFIVNDQKSFYGEGPFRESCGGDFHAGYNVRPYNVRSPTSMKTSALAPWLYIIFNSLQKKYISYFGELKYVYDREVFRTIFALFKEYGIVPSIVPPYLPDDAGLKIGEDLFRFQTSYDLNFKPIARDVHGTYHFSYSRFVYWNRKLDNPVLQYALWLKKPTLSRRKPTHVHYLRKRGGYVVAKAYSSHWTVRSR